MLRRYFISSCKASMEPQQSKCCFASIIFSLGYCMLLQNSCAVPAPAGGSLESLQDTVPFTGSSSAGRSRWPEWVMFILQAMPR